VLGQFQFDVGWRFRDWPRFVGTASAASSRFTSSSRAQTWSVTSEGHLGDRSDLAKEC